MNWKLIQTVTGEPEIDTWGGDDEDLSVGYSLLRSLAESDETLVEVSPGVWRHTGPDLGNSGPGR